MKFAHVDKHGTKITLLSQGPGADINWIFLPGGPGADASYFDDLITVVDLPGNIWTLDFLENGHNLGQHEFSKKFDFDQWGVAMKDALKEFDNAVIVGHSFGAMYPLLFPELESEIIGFVSISGAPSIWYEAAGKKATQQKGLPPLEAVLLGYSHHSDESMFNAALEACLPYHFTEKGYEKGRQVMSQLPFNPYAGQWWRSKVYKTNYSAKWVPSVPTLIIGGAEDYVIPVKLYQQDQRFQKDNIQIHEVQEAGHFPWLEKPKEIASLLELFAQSLLG